MVVSGLAAAQVTSRLGRFQVDKIKGCAPFTVNITTTNLITTGECTGSKPCLMTFEGTTQVENTFQHIYNTPGTYTLSVLYQSIGADDIIITVDPNIQPNFEVYRCSSNDVVIKVTDNNYEQYVINFADGSPEVAIPFSNNAIAQHDYANTTPATYNIAVRGRDSDPNAADNCTARNEAVTTLTAIPNASITAINATSNTGVQLAVAASTQILHRLEIAVNNSTSFQVLQNVYNSTTIDVSNLLLQTNYYCFRLSAFDPCTNSNNYSNTVCTQDFDVAFDNGVNRLTWRTATAGATTVRIERREVVSGITQVTNGVPVSPPFFDDQDYDCNIEYCYQITVTYAGGGTSTSLNQCGVGEKILTHPAVDNVTASIVNGAAQLTWTVDPLLKLQGFVVSRSSNGGALSAYATTPNVTYTDGAYTTEGAYCYQISYSDLCQNYSAAGVVVCPMRLLGTINDANVVTLNWTKYQGWKDGVQAYTLEKYNINGGLIGSFPVALDTFLVDDQPDLANQIVAYRVVATSVAGGSTAFSNIVTFTKEVNLNFPTAFTPNADQLNDSFRVTGQYVDKMNIRIFDRWGILVFASDGNEPWNGTREGLPMPESAYVWKAEIKDLAGRTLSREGTVVLIRN
jgi:gliding motility-associated-like protein